MLAYDPSFVPQGDPLPQLVLEPAGFMRLPSADTFEIQALADAVRQECEVLLVIGIGGSDLGARAVHRALNHQFYNLLPNRGGPRLLFIGDTTDFQALQETLDIVDLHQAMVAVISKSGDTLEQMATFLYIRKRLSEAVGIDEAPKRIIVLTDPEAGSLREMVRQEGYRSLPVPTDVGGRFSVLSSVGLFPLAVGGIDIDGLLAGAREQAEHSNDALAFAVHQFEAAKRGQDISVFMPYSQALSEFGRWYRQLWAESLGKRKDLAPTPIAALGPTDQHSQLQLYMQGPNDKIFTFLTVAASKVDATVPGDLYMSGHTFSELLLTECRSTAQALHEAGRPSATITIDRLDAQHLGALIYFFELAAAYSGKLYGINPYDQPGVERSKQLVREALSTG